MERQFFTFTAAVVCSVILSGTLSAEEELPVVDVGSGGAAAQAELELAADSVEEVADEVGKSAEEFEKTVVKQSEGLSDKTYVPQGDWNLNVNPDPDVRIRKIYEFLNDRKVTKTGKDFSLEYEFKYFNHGAITKAQKHNRKGQYYVVTWTNHAEPADFELRIDYRQSKTRDKINTIKIPYPNAKGTFKGTFSITGDRYTTYGGILSWRISVVRNGVIVAEKKSFVW